APLPFQRLSARVLAVHRGSTKPGDSLTFFIPGGKRPDCMEVMVSTSPAVEDYVGREALVFLARGGPLAPPGELGLPDGDHGIYHVDRNRSGERVVRAKAGSPIDRDITLDSFAAEVRATLASAGRVK